MRFDYASIISLAADTGEAIAVFRPEVEIRIHGPNGSKAAAALIDTGADNTMLPGYIARELAIPLRRAIGPAAQAFGGQTIAASYADVEIELVHADGKLRWLVHVYFLDEDDEEEAVLAGRDGFLEYFTATFIGDEFALELKPNEYLPTNRRNLK